MTTIEDGAADDATVAAQPQAPSLPRLLPPLGQVPEGLRDHIARFGRPPQPPNLIRLAEEAGLTGRGGAAFPIHRKLSAVKQAAESTRRRPVVIANGAETEPVSDKDATLLWLAPHLVLDGLQLAAEAVNANRAILYVHAHRRGDVGVALIRALSERATANLDRIKVEVVEAPPRFLAGQETALVNHLAGGPAVPLFAVPRITERGLGNSPTLVHNAETLGHLALIARYSARWFRAVGTRHEPGSMLCTIRRADGAPKVTEVPLGMPLRDLVSPEAAVLVGGYHGTWLPAAKVKDLTLDNWTLNKAGARVGAGVVISLPSDRCGLTETARVVRYLALESAAQCGPCLNGLPRIAAALTELAGSRPRARTRDDLERWCGLVTGRGACHHPDGTAAFVRSALVSFAAEVDRHARGKCSATSHEPFLPVPDGAPASEKDWT
jgi:NADH:ubiquinone oxidoreductase subunit F (NADH-binding)